MPDKDCDYHKGTRPTFNLSFCPLSLGIFLGTAVLVALNRRQSQRNSSEDETLPTCQVVFVLGGPGAGKGTQCELVTQHQPGWSHLSAGDLLRAERQRGGELGDTINKCIADGRLVPSKVTCRLLEKGMHEVYAKSGGTKFLIDGFPRSQGNAEAWKDTMSHHKVEFVLFLDCPEEVMIGRLLERGQTSGRNDDNMQVIKKRFETFELETAPIVDWYDQQGKVKRVSADKGQEDVYADVAALFETL
jgi:UMP-CMP kinase|uniref:UMP-CMP kinase n=1 Tax=Phaeodactylum tricornutum TaxID=2850 RepID=A0A8J9SBY4_PHATR